MQTEKNGTNTDLLAGILFAVLGSAFCLGSVTTVAVGNAFRMGPGFFPGVVGGLLAVLGVVIAVKALAARQYADMGKIPWRAIILIPIGFIGFGLAVRPIGLALATFFLAIMAAFASAEMKVTKALLVAAIMTGVCIFIFIFALGLKIPLLGDWLR